MTPAHRHPTDPDLDAVARRIWQAGVQWDTALHAAIMLRADGHLANDKNWWEAATETEETGHA